LVESFNGFNLAHLIAFAKGIIATSHPPTAPDDHDDPDETMAAERSRMLAELAAAALKRKVKRKWEPPIIPSILAHFDGRDAFAPCEGLERRRWSPPC
jgi:hypothetical protein